MARILVLANHYNTLRIFRRELLIALVESDNQVIIAIPECDEENKRILESYGTEVRFIEMERRGMNPVKDISLFNTYVGLLKQLRPDKVITYTIKCNIYGAMACKLFRIPCYVNITGLGSAFQGHGRIRKLVSLMYKVSLNKAERVFFENAGNRDTLVSDHIVKLKQTVVMPGAGVNVDEFTYQPYPDESEGLRFLTVGRLMQEKGTDELFQAIRVICKKYPGTQFVFIGWYEDDYKEKTEELEKLGYIRFDGWQSDVRPYYRDCHCIIHPSWHEGMSNTLLEGAASGRPLITNNVHGCKEAVEDGVNGFLCEKKNERSLTNAIERFILLPHAIKMQMGLAGRKKMIREFSKDDVVRKTLQELGE